MNKTKNIYLIPGLGENTNASNYKYIKKLATENKFKLVPVEIGWSTDMDMTDFIEQADCQIPEKEDGYLMGFSFGSYIAAILSKKKKLSGFIFCSTSPYFKENISHLNKEAKDYFGEKMIKSFKKYSFPKKVSKKAWFLIGEKDWDIAIKTNKTAYKNWAGDKKFILIKNTGHKLNSKEYKQEISGIIKKL